MFGKFQAVIRFAAHFASCSLAMPRASGFTSRPVGTVRVSICGYWDGAVWVQCGATGWRRVSDRRGDSFVVEFGFLRDFIVQRGRRQWSGSRVPRQSIWYACGRFGSEGARELAMRHFHGKEDVKFMQEFEAHLKLRSRSSGVRVQR